MQGKLVLAVLWQLMRFHIRQLLAGVSSRGAALSDAELDAEVLHWANAKVGPYLLPDMINDCMKYTDMLCNRWARQQRLRAITALAATGTGLCQVLAASRQAVNQTVSDRTLRAKGRALQLQRACMFVLALDTSFNVRAFDGLHSDQAVPMMPGSTCLPACTTFMP